MPKDMPGENYQSRLCFGTAAGRLLISTEGRDYLDFTSGGIFSACSGAGSPVVAGALEEYVNSTYAPLMCCYNGVYDNPYTLRYIDMLKEFTGYGSVALFVTGSEACEAFWRLCRVWTGKPGVWGGLVDPDLVGTDKPPYDAMHGWTLGSMIMAGKVYLPGIGAFPELGEGRFGLQHDATAGMIMEPYHAASAQFHKISPTIERIEALTKEFKDIPLCMDEVQGGFGRTGKLWAHEWYDGRLRPEFIVAGKAMGGGMPLSALLGPPDIMEDPGILKHAHLHSTHSGHPVMAAVGIAVLEEIQKNDLISRSREMGGVLEELLSDFPVRHHCGRGLLAGLEFQDAEQAGEVVRSCQDRGLLVVNTGRKWVKLGPAYTVTEEELEKGVKILRAAIEEVLNANDDKAHGLPGPGHDEGD